MKHILNFFRTYKTSIALTVLTLNLLAGFVALFGKNFYNAIFHFSLVVAVTLDLTDRN